MLTGDHVMEGWPGETRLRTYRRSPHRAGRLPAAVRDRSDDRAGRARRVPGRGGVPRSIRSIDPRHATRHTFEAKLFD